METVLMVVTLVALALAIGMSLVAWRLLHEHRQRATARVEMLHELALSLDTPDQIPTVRSDERAHPAIQHKSMRALAPRTPARPTIVQPAARFVTLEDEEDASSWDRGLEDDGMFRDTLFTDDSTSVRVSPVPAVMFGAPSGAQHRPSNRRWLTLAAVGAIMAVLISGAYTIYHPALAADATSAIADSLAPRRGDPHPIELLSLRHSADPDGAFTVTGLVQNPPDGLAVKKTVAVVYLFDRDGNYFAAGKAALDFASLQPGEESPFVVRIAAAGKVGRYRVGFRSEDGGVVSHVDRRGQLPDGTTGNAIDSAPAAQHSAAAFHTEDRP